jgi:predicted nucleotidyltransferase
MVEKNNMSILSEILSSKVREKVFQHLFDGQDHELHMREIERRSGCSIGAIQTELKKLSRLELVTSRRDGNRLYYHANREHPLYADICSMVDKTVGLVGLLNVAVAKLPDIDSAFLFGSMGKGTEDSRSDVDLMIVGAIGLRSLSAKLSAVSKAIGREINPYVLNADEFRQRIEQNEHFVMNVMKSPKVFIKGGDDDLGKLAGQQLAAEP